MNRKNDVKASDWSLSVIQDGRERESLDGLDLKSGAGADISYNFVPTFDDADLPKLSFRVNYAKDMYDADNVSAEVSLQIDKPAWPSVTDLSGEI